MNARDEMREAIERAVREMRENKSTQVYAPEVAIAGPLAVGLAMIADRLDQVVKLLDEIADDIARRG